MYTLDLEVFDFNLHAIGVVRIIFLNVTPVSKTGSISISTESYTVRNPAGEPIYTKIFDPSQPLESL